MRPYSIVFLVSMSSCIPIGVSGNSYARQCIHVSICQKDDNYLSLRLSSCIIRLLLSLFPLVLKQIKEISRLRAHFIVFCVHGFFKSWVHRRFYVNVVILLILMADATRLARAVFSTAVLGTYWTELASIFIYFVNVIVAGISFRNVFQWPCYL